MSKTKNSEKIISYEMGVAALLKVLLMKLRRESIYYYDISPSSFLLKILFGISFIRKGITSIVRQYIPSKYISEYEGAFFLIENMTVDLTISFFNDKRISDMKVVRAYKNHYGTDRIDMVVKYFIQNKIRSFLRFYYQVKRFEDNITVIVPESELYRYILEKNPFSDLKPTRIAFSGLKALHILYGIELFAASFFEMLSTLLRQKYTFHKFNRREYKICMRAHIPKSEGLLRNDFLINGKDIKSGEVLFFIDAGEEGHRKKMSEYYEQNGYHYTALEDLRIPVSVLSHIIKDYLMLPFRIFMLYLLERQFHVFNALLTFSRIALRIKYELLFYYYDFRMMIMFHSAGSEMVIAPVLCRRYDSKFAIYNFGSTVSWGRWSPYAFQTADYYFTWGDKIISLYRPTCEFGEIVKAGFWGKEEYIKICAMRDELKRKIAGGRDGSHIITFYDLPYFYERSTFTAWHLYNFYNAALRCSEFDNVTVILKMKSRYNINGARYPSDIKSLFDKLWREIGEKSNIIILDTSDYDPLHIIAVSDINVTLELSSPSTIALICGEAGLFYNVVYDYASHSLYPKYFGRLIFDDIDKLVDIIGKHLRREIDLKNLVEDADLRGYDEYRDSEGTRRLTQAVLERIN